MPVTLNDDQVGELRRQLEQGQVDKRDADIARAVLSDPELSDAAKALLKRKFPNAQMEGYDIRQEMNDRFQKDREERAAEKKAAADKALDEKITKARKDLRENRNMTDDGIERLEAFMVERGIQDHEDAADLWLVRNPRPVEETASSHFWQHDKSDGFKEIAEDPEKYAYNEIFRAVKNDERNRAR